MSEFAQIQDALNTLRSEVEAKSVRQDVVERCNKFLDSQEAKNQELVKSLAEAKAKAEETETKFASLEAELRRPNLSSEEKEGLTAQVKSIDSFMKSGEVEKKYLRTDSNVNGGYLVPVEYIQEILKNITEISPVRQVARIFTSNAKQIEIPVRATLAGVASVGEGAPASQSNSTYGKESIIAHKYVGRTDYTLEMLRFSAFNIESEIRADLVEDLARQEGADFVNGNGLNKAQGFMQDSRIAELNSGNASALTADVLMKIQGELKVGYNPVFMFNRKTLHQHIRILKGTTNDHYLFQPALNGSVPNTVAGVPYVLANDMPDVGAGTFPIVFGDFNKGYAILDNVNLEIKRDEYSDISNGVVRFYLFKFTGGKVVLPEAIKKIKIAA